ncbi:Type IV pilus biogenesis protein PilZ [gamma proteobacterium IMCC1989]|jgi:type IV pilus assembly protein PilZ|nr:Type IV pilus biogenesis protein PilZ [gamma proteobacterium IMCC1989]
MSGFSIGGAGQGILSLSIKDVANLHAAYMPYVENGGLFIPTKKKYRMGDEVFVLLALIDEADKIPISGKVIWLTPSGAQGNRAAGIGVQFSEKEGNVVDIIEKYLVGILQSDRPTHTM